MHPDDELFKRCEETVKSENAVIRGLHDYMNQLCEDGNWKEVTSLGKLANLLSNNFYSVVQTLDRKEGTTDLDNNVDERES